MPTVDTEILLATYNGARYLPALLLSLDAQTDQDWRLVARDDGSSDETIALLSDWGMRHPERFLLLRNDTDRRGASANFSALLEQSTSRYFLPCDQDDVWLDDKVARLRSAMRAAEAEVSDETPIIVHTDLKVVDENLEPLADSMWALANLRLPPKDRPWGLMTVQNVVTGCAMMGNAALLRVALPVPDDCKMHDWWLAMAASFLGRVVPISEPGLLYRQHGANALGADRWSFWQDMGKAVSFLAGDRRDIGREFTLTRRQAAAFLRQMRPHLDPDQISFLESFGAIEDMTVLQRRKFYRHHDMRLKGMVRNAGLWFLT